MKRIILVSFFFLAFYTVHSATVFSRDGIRLNYEVDKVKTIFVPALKKHVVIWKGTIELVNSNNRPVAVTSPCCLYYAFAYLFPAEIETVQTQLPEYKISNLYKTYATPKPTLLKARQKVSNMQYFATYDDINLRAATYNLEVKYSF